MEQITTLVLLAEYYSNGVVRNNLKVTYAEPTARRQPREICCLMENWRLWIVGMGMARTTMSEAMFRTAWESATFWTHVRVPGLRGLHGPPVMLQRANVYARMATAAATTTLR